MSKIMKVLVVVACAMCAMLSAADARRVCLGGGCWDCDSVSCKHISRCATACRIEYRFDKMYDNMYAGGNAKADYDDYLDGLDQCEAEMKKLCGAHKNTGMQCFECLHEHVKVLKPLCAHTGNGRKFCAKNSFRKQVKNVQRNEVRTKPYPSF